MIQVVLRGRLGNWLFQYAAGRSLAALRGTDLALNLSNKLELRHGFGAKVRRSLSRFPLRCRYTIDHPLMRIPAGYLGLRRDGPRFFREKGAGFDPEVLTLPDGSFLFGYFQSESYFREVAAEIRSELTWPLPERPEVQELVEAMAGDDSVSVHVRRTDYLTWSRVHVAGPGYYAEAARAIRERVERPRFFVFSDDIAWCRENLGLEPAEYVDLPAPEQPVLDMALMSRCRHHIAVNSTFSWWGAWLDPRPDKVVVVPERWYVDPAHNARVVAETVPEEWLRVDG